MIVHTSFVVSVPDVKKLYQLVRIFGPKREELTELEKLHYKKLRNFILCCFFLSFGAVYTCI
jgi:hypothetical protein